MTKNVSYKHCVCDFCGDEVDVNMSLPLPKHWDHIKVSAWTEADLCNTCLKQLVRLIDKLKTGEISLVDIGCAEAGEQHEQNKSPVGRAGGD